MSAEMMGGRPSEEENRWQRNGKLRKTMQHTVVSREKTKKKQTKPKIARSGPAAMGKQ
jgi:hypothetical protein